MIKNNIHKH